MNARARLLLDLGMFAALLVAFNPAWTGIAVHEWLSLAVVFPLLVHLIVNWESSVRTVLRFAERLLHVSRLNIVVDAGLFVMTVACMLSGLMVSQVIIGLFGAGGSPSTLWVAVHSVSAEATIALLLVHFGLHWRWTAAVIRRMAHGATRRGAALHDHMPASSTPVRVHTDSPNAYR